MIKSKINRLIFLIVRLIEIKNFDRYAAIIKMVCISALFSSCHLSVC